MRIAVAGKTWKPWTRSSPPGSPAAAEAVRWALTRIRERPAFEQLRARSREIEALKSQF